jgi:hypothetical protein
MRKSYVKTVHGLWTSMGVCAQRIFARQRAWVQTVVSTQFIQASPAGFSTIKNGDFNPLFGYLCTLCTGLTKETTN